MSSLYNINIFDLLPNTIWYDIYKQKYTYNNLQELYNLNSETREDLLYMIKFGHLKLFHGSVYASGKGKFGTLGDSRTDDHREGTPITIDKSNMQDKRVIQVSAGMNYSLFLCEDGSVYSSGSGKVGKLGDGRIDNHNEGTPIPIDTSNMEGKRETGLTCQSVSQRVIQVSSGSVHSLFLCEDGSVYASGNGEYGELGDGRTDRHEEGTPISINIVNMNNKKVIQVAAALEHSLFLCEDGSVYASGNGYLGRLGDGNIYFHYEGTPIPIDTSNMEGKRETGLTCQSVSQRETGLTCQSVSQRVIQVSAGWMHSLFLCEDGSVYASGRGDDGVLGDGRIDDHYESTPIPINTSNMEGKRVVQVSAGRYYSLFLCEDGSVYSSGVGEYGRLGDGRTDEHEEGTPIKIDTANIGEKRVIQVSAGEFHSLFLCEDGSVYASGYGENGILGDCRTDEHEEGTPIPIDTANIDSKKVIQVSAGDYHSLFLT